MFEKEIKFISDFSLNKIKKLGAFFTFDKLLNGDLHPAIIQYISAEIDYLIYEDRKKLLQASVFDYTGAEVGKHFNAIANEIKKNKRVSFEDIKKLIVQAVSFNINYTARPKWSLTKFVYDTNSVQSVEDIKMMLNYLYYYDYYRTILLEYFLKKKLSSASSIEFEVILNKIDKNLFSTQSEPIINNAINSIADFHNIGGVNKSKVSLSAVEAFLKEKNMIDHIFRLKKAYPHEVKQNVEAAEVKNVIHSAAFFAPREIQEEEDAIAEEKELLNESEIVSGDKEEEIIIDEEDQEEETLFEDEDEDERELPKFDVEKDDELIESTNEENEEDLLSSSEESEKMQTDEELEAVEEEENDMEELDINESDDLLSFYNEQLKSFEEEAPEIENDDEEVEFDISEKKNLDTLYDFEEEPENEKLNDIEEESGNEKLKEEIEEELNESEEFQIEDTGEVIGDEDEILPEADEIQEDDKDDAPASIDEKEDINKNIVPEGIENESKEETVDEKKSIRVKDKDVFSFLSNKQMDKIVGNIFNADREDFANTMEKISECENYDEATEILKGVFFTYKINPYSKDAVLITNAVSNYFDQA